MVTTGVGLGKISVLRWLQGYVKGHYVVLVATGEG